MTPKRKRGEKDKLTPEVQRIIVDAIAAGVPLKWAAVRGGVSEGTALAWLRRARQGGKSIEKYVKFSEAVKKAQSDAVAVRVARIGKAGQGGMVERTTTTTTDANGVTKTVVTEKVCPGEWTADAWYLERIHNEHFGSNKAEIKTLQKQVAELMKKVNGDADP